MMPGLRRVRHTASPEERAQQTLSDELERFSDAAAPEMGPAPGARKLSDDIKLHLWGQRDPAVDPEQLKAMLMQGQVPPDLLDPTGDNALTLVKQNPEIAQMFGQPLDDRMADIMTRLAEYPLRLALLNDKEDDPDGMVKEANRLDGLWQRRVGGAADVQPMVDASAQPSQPVPTDAPPAAVGAPSSQPRPLPMAPDMGAAPGMMAPLPMGG